MAYVPEQTTHVDRYTDTPVTDTNKLLTQSSSSEGIAYIDPDAIGANPQATIYFDGTIVGSTDNGSYVKYANGEIGMILEFDYTGSLVSAAVISLTPTFPYPLLTADGVASCNGDTRNSVLYVFKSYIASISTMTFGVRNDSGATRTYGYSRALIKGRWK